MMDDASLSGFFASDTVDCTPDCAPGDSTEHLRRTAWGIIESTAERHRGDIESLGVSVEGYGLTGSLMDGAFGRRDDLGKVTEEAIDLTETFDWADREALTEKTQEAATRETATPVEMCRRLRDTFGAKDGTTRVWRMAMCSDVDAVIVVSEPLQQALGERDGFFDVSYDPVDATRTANRLSAGTPLSDTAINVLYLTPEDVDGAGSATEVRWL